MEDATTFDPLAASQVDALAPLLATSFDDDPAFQYMFPAAETRTRGLSDFFARNLRTHLPHACTQIAVGDAGELRATMTLRPPQGIPISLATMLRRGLLPFALSQGVAAVKRLLWLKETYDELELRASENKPHWYVHMMAVRRDLQGRGVGSALLRGVLAAATTHSEHSNHRLASMRRLLSFAADVFSL